MSAAPPIEWRDFFESVPPLESRLVRVELKPHQNATKLIPPPIYLHCTHADCGGMRFYDYRGEDVYLPETGKYKERFFLYICRNCRGRAKTYALRLGSTEPSEEILTMTKLGEMPRYGEPRPNVVADVLDDEINYFERGYRAEADGLGIGAFAYYRRFVESHKDKIIAEIKKVATVQNLPQSIIDGLDRAAKMREFKAAVEEIKDAIPDSLKINGANPLTLLHNALSGGLHSDDDVECLEIAQDIRTVLTALASRTSELLKAESGFKAAVTRLNQRNAGQKPTPPK